MVVLPVVILHAEWRVAEVAEEVVKDNALVIALDLALAVALIQVQAQFGKMGTIKKEEEQWHHGQAKSITFIVTKDCQLACKYCYLVGKNIQERMTWEIAQKAIDYILDREEDFPQESVVWDFIGGEPFLEIDLIDRICDYIKVEMYRRSKSWV